MIIPELTKRDVEDHIDDLISVFTEQAFDPNWNDSILLTMDVENEMTRRFYRTFGPPQIVKN